LLPISFENDLYTLDMTDLQRNDMTVFVENGTQSLACVE